MPRLPGPEQLGGVPSMRSGRGVPNVGNLDTGASAIAKGVGAIGDAMVGIATERRKEDDALDLIKADSHLQQGLTELNRQFETDPDHATYGPRFTEGAARIRTEAEAMIRNPQHRERWLPRADTSITSSRDRVLGRGTALAREERYDELDGILTNQRNSYLTAPDDDTRERTRQTMADSIELGRRSGLLHPRQARELERRHIVGAIEDDAREAIWRDPYGTLRDLTEGDQRGRADSSGAISDQGLSHLRRAQPDMGNLTPTQRAAADRRLREETAELSTHLNENAPGLTQLQHDALVSFGHRRGRAALDAMLPDIQARNWNAVAATMATPRQPAAPTQPDDPGYRTSAGKGPSALSVAQRFLGNNEREHADVLAEFFRRSGGQRLNPAQTAWCMAFVNAALGESGSQGTGTLMARDALRIGTPTRDPQEGDIVVMSRGSDPSLGHVGFFVKRNPDGSIDVLSGNAGPEGRVSVDTYDANRVLGYRTPPRAGTQVPGVDVDAAANRVLAADNDRAAQEAEMVLGRAPAPRWSRLPPDRRRALVTNAQVALRAITQQEIGDEVERVRRTGQMDRDQSGMTALDRARRVLQPNQFAKAELAIIEAQRTFTAIAGTTPERPTPLAQMTESQAADHLTALAPANQSPDESYRTSVRVQDRATRAWNNILTLRRTDPAQWASGGTTRGQGARPQATFGPNGELIVSPGGDDDLRTPPAPEVTSAIDLIRRRQPDVNIVLNEDGSFDVAPAEGASPTQQREVAQQARAAIIEARLAAQMRVGIPDWQRRPITQAEAEKLLNMPADSAMPDEREFLRRLREASDRAEALYGPRLASDVFKAAIGFRSNTTDRRAEADKLITRMVRNQDVQPEEILRLNSLDRIDRLGRLWDGPAEEGLSNFGVQRDDRPAIMPNVGVIERSAERQAREAMPKPEPNERQRQWVLENLADRQAVFDREFGAGATARALEKAKR